MRELGFSQMWPKLDQETLTTFRFKRRDKRDWGVGEIVKVVFKPRSKQRKVLGVAEILTKESRKIPWHGRCPFEAPLISNEEANADGFPDYESTWADGRPKHMQGYFSMWVFLFKGYGPQRLFLEPMNKLTLRWKERT